MNELQFLRRFSAVRVIIILTLIGLVACNKNDDAVNHKEITLLNNSWEVTGGSLDSKYVYFGSDNYAYYLYQYQNKFRGMRRESFELIEGTDEIKFSDGRTFHYSITENELTIGDNYKAIFAKGKFDFMGPDNKSWVNYLTEINSGLTPSTNVSDICNDGQHLWYGGIYGSGLYKINKNDFKIDTIITTTFHGTGIESDNGYLWTATFYSVYKIDLTTGTSLFTSITFGDGITGIAKEGNNIWCSSLVDHTVYKYNIDENSIVKKYEFNNDNGYVIPGGSTFYDGYLYIVTTNVINKCNPVNFEVVDHYYLDVGKDEELFGITYDGQYFYITTIIYDEYFSEYNAYGIYKAGF